MKSYSEISTRYMKQNKKRTTLTIVGIALATILIFAVGTFLLSFKDSMISYERATQGDYEFKLNKISADKVEKVINHAEVKDSTISEESTLYNIKGIDKEVYLDKGNKGYFDKLFTSKILEGRKPSKEGEVVINSSAKNVLKVNLNDEISLLNERGEEYKVNVVGIYESNIYSSNGALDFTTYFTGNDLNPSKSYYVSLNLKSAKNKQNIVKKVINDSGIEVVEGTKSDNSQLLYLTGNGGNDGISGAIQNMAIFVVVIIMLCTITVIYNSFNISVIERIRYFGILKAIGATPKQIKRIIYKEGLLMGLIALPVGCVIGFLALKFGIKIFIGDTLMFVEDFKVGFYPIIVLVTTVLVAITILLSVMGPARKAKKVSAVDAMRNKNEIKIGKLKRRKGRIVGKIFGIEGSVAYKNIRRTPFRFIVTVLALTISIVMFNVFYGFIDFAKQSVLQQFMYSPFDSYSSKINVEESFTENELNELTNKEFMRDVYKYRNEKLRLLIPNSDINKEYGNKTGRGALGGTLYEDLGFNDLGYVDTYIAGDKELQISERNIVEGSFDIEAIKKGGVILIDGTMTTNSDKKKEIVRATNYKVGDKIKIPKVKDYSTSHSAGSEEELKKLVESQEKSFRDAISNGEFYELEVVAIANKEPFMGMYVNNGIKLMLHEDYYNNIFVGDGYNELCFDFNGDNEARQDAIKYFDDINPEGVYNYEDIGDQLKEIEGLYKQIEFFVYCFISIVTVISIVNIFNTISTNLLLRRKEFSTMKAIGMTEKQLKKSVMLEGTLYGILAALIGGIVSAILLVLLINVGGGLADVEYKFDLIAFTASIVCAIGITYISTLVPLKKLKKLSIVEGISEEE
ncbi:ABC transporter permease [Clostridium paraputrificum]|uniref:ABC transporter permease n=1 Tax=Clostridium paraputrificum TaxID=29363 RepID=UPI003D33D5C2